MSRTCNLCRFYRAKRYGSRCNNADGDYYLVPIYPFDTCPFFSERKGGKPRRRVSQIDPDSGEVIQTYESATEAADFNNSTPNKIINVCMGRTRQAEGFFWRYADQIDDGEDQ